MISRRMLGLGVLLFGLMASALGLIYCKYKSRLIFVEIVKLEKTMDDLEVEWAQMELEQTTILEQNRVELAARKKKMVMPFRENVVSVKP